MPDTFLPLAPGSGQGGFVGPTSGPIGPYTNPPILPYTPTDPVTPASTINQARTRTPLDIQANLAGAGSLVPPLFGRSRVVGMPEIIDGNQGRLLLAYTFCEGVIDGFEQLSIDGRNQAVISLLGVNTYATGGIDSGYRLSLGDTSGIAGIRTFLFERLSVYGSGNIAPNARIAIELNPDEFRNLPRVEVIATGLSLYDPRTTLTEYSDNAALATGHIARAWPGMTVDEDSLADWAEDCDDPSRRRTIGLVLNRKATIEQHLATLCPVFGASFSIEWQTIKFTPHKRRDRVFTFGPRQIISSSSRRGHGRNNTPDEVVAVGYDPDLNQRTEAYAIDSINHNRLSRVEATGISDPGQLKRLAVERLNRRTVSDRYWTGIVTDEGKQIENGDRIGVRDIANDLELDIIVDSWRPRDGDYELSGWRYDDALFSTDTQSGPSAPDTSLPEPGIVPTPVVTSVTVDTFVAPDQFRATVVLEDPESLNKKDLVLEVWTDDELTLIRRTEPILIRSLDEVAAGPPRTISYLLTVPREFSFKVRAAVVNTLGRQGDYSAFVASVATIDDPAIPTLVNVTKVTSGPQFGAGELVGYEVTEYGLEWDNVSWGYEGTYICQLYDSTTGQIAAESILKPGDLTVGGGTSSMSFGQVNADNNEYEARVAIQAIYGQVGDFNNATIDDHTPELIIIFVPPPSYAAVTDGVLVTIPNGTIDEGTREYKFEYRETSGSGLTVFGVAKSEQFLDTTHTGASLPFSYRVTMVRRGGNEISSTETLT